MRQFVGYIFLVVVLFHSCQKDGTKPCTEEEKTAAILTAFPDSLKAGEAYDVNIKYVLDNSCGSFDRFEINSTEKSFDVKLIAEYEGCNCNIEFSEHQVEFTIDVDYPGVYEYRFWQADNDWDIRSITIYE
ncbi:MAG: hypothetical protein WDZ35_14185 [Crocinitomicaceae bacterium]